MTHPTLHHATHDITISASSDLVLDLLVDAGRWPQILGPTIHVRYLEHGDSEERLRIWARANDDVRSWESHRSIDRRAGTITFRQVVPRPPTASMTGRWTVAPAGDGTTRLTLDHTYAAIDDDPDGLAWIERATDTNSRNELASMRRVAEALEGVAAVTFSFADTVSVKGTVEDVYEFLFDADRWPERLDHVAGVELRDHDGVQGLRMDTVAPDGSTHTTHSYRVCDRPTTIAYKQTETPPLLDTHRGCWTVEAGETGAVRVTSAHEVTLNPDAIETVLGADATVADARDYIQRALSANSGKTLDAARAWAEGARLQGVGDRG